MTRPESAWFAQCARMACLLVSLLLLCVATGIPAVHADTLTLSDGAQVHGQYTGGNLYSVSFKVGDHTRTYPLSKIRSLTFTDRVSTNRPAPGTGTPIPARSLLVASLRNPLAPGLSRPGDTFRATLVRVVPPRRDFGKAIFRRFEGRTLVGRVVRINARTMVLECVGIGGEGAMVPVSATPLRAQAEGDGPVRLPKDAEVRFTLERELRLD